MLGLSEDQVRSTSPICATPELGGLGRLLILTNAHFPPLLNHWGNSWFHDMVLKSRVGTVAALRYNLTILNQLRCM